MSDFAAALEALVDGEVDAPAGTSLFRQGDAVRSYYLVRSGCVHLVRWGADGTSAVMQRATAGMVLAESSVFATAYHCDGLCVSDSTAGRIEISRVRAALERQPALLRSLAQHLGREVQLTRARVELLSCRTVAERLDAWLALHGALPERGNWRAIADDIGVSPEAFYRELQRRRQER